MKSFPKYPEIENLYKCTDILNYKCVITEKIHGTNARFMYNKENGLLLGSRENIIYKDGQSTGGLYGFAEFAILNLEQKLKDNYEYRNHVFYGEFFGSGIQKGVKYSENKDLRIFDVRHPEGRFLDWQEVKDICFKIGFEIVPEIDIGMFDISYLESIRDNTSVVGKLNGFVEENNTWEGVVLKPAHMRIDKHGNWLMAKYKSEKWDENVKAKKPKSIDPDKIELQTKAKEFAGTCVTLGRVSNIIEHITRGIDKSIDMKRTPEFLRELVNDVKKEHGDVYAALNKNKENAYNKAVSSAGSVLWKKYVEEYYLKR